MGLLRHQEAHWDRIMIDFPFIQYFNDHNALSSCLESQPSLLKEVSRAGIVSSIVQMRAWRLREGKGLPQNNAADEQWR